MCPLPPVPARDGGHAAAARSAPLKGGPGLGGLGAISRSFGRAVQRRFVAPDLVLLHWMVALLFVLAITGIVGRGLLPSGHAWRPGMRSMHVVVGQVIFLLALVRVVVRLRSGMPHLDGAPAWSVWIRRVAHGLLYAVMLGQPLTGVMFMQAGDKTVSLFGLALPTFMPSDPQLHFQLKDLHVFVGNAFYALIALHVLAALWHHGIRRDDTLRRMLVLRRDGDPDRRTPPRLRL